MNRKIRNALETESEQLEWLRTNYTSELCMLIPEDSSVESLLKTVLETSAWEDHSGKGEPPPDFVNHAHRIMLEAMRVDDHERPGDRKGFVNPSRAHESEILQQYRSKLSELLGMAADNARLYVVGHTDLPTKEDHSYSMYLSSFRRIVEKHASQTSNYRQNHPGYKLVFYVFDESTGYFESTERIDREVHEGDNMRGRPHIFLADKAFLDVIRKSNADYLIWHTPFKHEHLFAEGLILPNTVLYDINRINVPECHYDPTRMISTEV